ncbi:MAG TPA: L-threonylcarbamoyladenylate synthase [Nitrosopumilaceae archaeon]|nr:L-threonylcarbamoyladenylate synthase [Nitrosopumilaceae archaeon]
MKVKCDKEGIEKASKIAKSGGVIIFPTDTVYGIGCDPYNKKSVDRIYQIKGRPKSKPFPVLAYSIEVAAEIVEFDKDSKKIAGKFWPGPLTLILKVKDEKLKTSLHLEEKIAIRVPNNQCLLNLLKNSKLLIGTSANISGENSFTNSQECYQKIPDFDIFLDDGDIKNGIESTILEMHEGNPIIHRIGALKKEEIMESF